MFDFISAGLSPAIFATALVLTLIAGVIKGTLGFAMPMILISGLGSLMPVELALAALTLPTLVTNFSQAVRQGAVAALGSVRVYWRMLIALIGCLLITAQFVPILPQAVLLAVLGAPIMAFALTQLLDYPLRVPVARRRRAEWLSGAVGGLYGGLSGVWGPPVIAYLVAVDTAKRDMVRILGVVFLVGAVALVAGHLVSGILTAANLRLSAMLVVPALAGLWVGYRVQDRLDAARFRRWTLVMMLIMGANLLRRAAGM